MLLLTLIDQPLAGFAQNTVVTYQGRVQSGGSDFSGAGQFKFALVTSTNTSVTATATATLSGGFVTIYTVTGGGNGYVTAPAVTVSGGGGSGATATATISGGVVTQINAANPGTGYSSPPTVTIAAPPENLLFTTFWSNDGTSSAGSEPSAAVSVAVSDGLFFARLGDAALPNMSPLSAVLFMQPDLQLRIWFNDGVNGFAVLSPAQPLTAAPYAFVAHSASNLLGTLNAANLLGTYSNAVNFSNPSNTFAGSVTGSGAGLASLNASQLTSGTVPSARLSGTYSGKLSFTNDLNFFVGDGKNLTGLNASELGAGTVPNARLAANIARTNQVWLLGGNAGTTAGTQFLGTTDDEPLELKVNGQRGLRIEPNTNGAPNIIGGSANNVVDAGVIGAFIGGVGSSNSTNRISSNFSSIVNGMDNLIQTNARFATIAGGQENEIQSGGSHVAIGGGFRNIITNADYAFIGSGLINSIENATYGVIGSGVFNNILSQSGGTIGGGTLNQLGGTNIAGSSSGTGANSHNAIVGGILNWIAAGSSHGFIGGGRSNLIGNGANFAVVPGGKDNRATGDFSFAAGRQAKADHDGDFVWADSQNANFVSTGSNQFLIRASGGVGIGTNNPAAALDVNGTVKAIQFLADGGSTAEASYTFQGDSNTGLFQPVANTLALTTAGTERMRIESGGNVGIGTNNPAFTLHVNGTARVEGHTTISALFALSRTTVVPTSNATLTPTTSYLVLNPAASVILSATTAIASGSVIGDVLILEGTDDFQTVTINDGANASLAAASRTLGDEDTLMLIWNGADWIEVSFSNN